jgi:hypothetical protein
MEAFNRTEIVVEASVPGVGVKDKLDDHVVPSVES